MNRTIAFLAIGACACLLAAPGASATNEPLLIENVTLLSPEQPQPLGNRYVLVRDGRIVSVSDQAIAAPAGARRLDGTGKFLAPGLTDAHVHVSQAIGLPFGTNDPAIAALEKEFFAQQPRSYLYFGVTQVLDPSNLRGESRGVRGAEAASGHLPLRRRAGGRRLSAGVHRQGDAPRHLQ